MTYKETCEDFKSMGLFPIQHCENFTDYGKQKGNLDSYICGATAWKRLGSKWRSQNTKNVLEVERQYLARVLKHCS